jgi:hypothetical protein
LLSFGRRSTGIPGITSFTWRIPRQLRFPLCFRLWLRLWFRLRLQLHRRVADITKTITVGVGLIWVRRRWAVVTGNGNTIPIAVRNDEIVARTTEFTYAVTAYIGLIRISRHRAVNHGVSDVI